MNVHWSIVVLAIAGLQTGVGGLLAQDSSSPDVNELLRRIAALEQKVKI